MTNAIRRYGSVTLSVLSGVGVFLFWLVGYPQALSFQEQYQLFLWTADYFRERVSLPGGLADWLGEFIVQFYYVEWLGALLLALLFVSMQRLTLSLLTPRLSPLARHLLSLLPPLFLLWLMGDENVLLSLPVAVVLAMAAALPSHRTPFSSPFTSILLIPVLYWLIGPVAWLYVVLLLARRGWRHAWTAGWLLAVQIAAYAFVLPQWPLRQVLAGLNYYRTPLQWPRLTGYESDRYELMMQDYLIRHERWDQLLERAGRHEVHTAYWCNSVNLALAKKRLLADRMFDYWQSGPDALLMPSCRDMVSNLPTAEAFWHLGMVNSAMRYMADIQESILNGRKSGRCEKRIVECLLVNGRQQVADKHLALLKHSLFYRRWAEETEREGLQADGGRLKKKQALRYKQDVLFSYPEVDKMLGLLFAENHDNRMALDYFIGQLLLNGNSATFVQALSWAEKYGGYQRMPLGYQDAVSCVRRQGNVPGSPYAKFISRMTGQGRTPSNTEQNETAH